MMRVKTKKKVLHPLTSLAVAKLPHTTGDGFSTCFFSSHKMKNFFRGGAFVEKGRLS